MLATAEAPIRMLNQHRQDFPCKQDTIDCMCRMLVHGKMTNRGEPDTSQHDIPVIEFEPTGLFGAHLPPASKTATPEDFWDAAEGIRAALTSGRDLTEYSLQASYPSSKHLSTDVIEVTLPAGRKM